jgi:hypothetical protein
MICRDAYLQTEKIIAVSRERKKEHTNDIIKRQRSIDGCTQSEGGGLTNTPLTLQGCHVLRISWLQSFFGGKKEGGASGAKFFGYFRFRQRRRKQDGEERRGCGGSCVQTASLLAANGFVDGANGIEESKVKCIQI